MAKLTTKEIRDDALKLLAQQPGGIHFMQLVKAVQALHPEDNENTIYTTISELHNRLPGQVVKPSRGLFQLATAAEDEENKAVPDAMTEPVAEKLYEEKFYASFADF